MERPHQKQTKKRKYFKEILNQPLKNKPTTTEFIPPLPKPNTEIKKNITIIADNQYLLPRISHRRTAEHIIQNARNDNNRIPKRWKNTLDNTTQQYLDQKYIKKIEINYKASELSKLITKQIYRILTDKKTKTKHRYERQTVGKTIQRLQIDKQTR